MRCHVACICIEAYHYEIMASFVIQKKQKKANDSQRPPYIASSIVKIRLVDVGVFCDWLDAYYCVPTFVTRV